MDDATTLNSFHSADRPAIPGAVQIVSRFGRNIHSLSSQIRGFYCGEETPTEETCAEKEFVLYAITQLLVFAIEALNEVVLRPFSIKPKRPVRTRILRLTVRTCV